MSETGYVEDCCFNDIQDCCPLKRRPCTCRCHTDIEEEFAKLRTALRLWEEFDFERDNPRRLTEHILALMVERDEWRRRAEDAETQRPVRNEG